MSYRKVLDKLSEKKDPTTGENGNIQPQDVIDFAIGKGHWRLPKEPELTQLLKMLKSDKVMDGADLTFDDLPSGSSKADKQAMENLKVEIGSCEVFTKKHVIKLWELAHDQRKRKLMIAGIVVGGVVVATGVTLGIMALINRGSDDNMKDTSNVNDEVSDIEVFEEDVPQVDIDTDSEI